VKSLSFNETIKKSNEGNEIQFAMIQVLFLLFSKIRCRRGGAKKSKLQISSISVYICTNS
jgi:hypothetical protein